MMQNPIKLDFIDKVDKNALYNILNNYVFKNLYFIFLIIGTILIIQSMILLKSRKRIVKKSRKDMFLEIIKFPFISLAKILSPKSDEKKYKLKNKINVLNPNITIETFYISKIVTPLIILVLVLIVHNTNYNYKAKEIMQNSIQKQIELEFYDQDKTSSNVKEDDLYYYNIVKGKYPNYKKIEFEDKEQAIKNITTVISSETELDTKDSEIISRRLYDKIIKLKSYTIGNKTKVLIILTFFLPDLILDIAYSMRRKKYKEDIEILKITTLILGGMENITVKKLLQSLQNVSQAYSYIIGNALNKYSSIQDGKDEAIMEMSNIVNLSQFRKLCSILRDISDGKKKSAIENLEEDMKMEDKENAMRDDDKIEKKTWVAILLISPSILLLSLLLLMPFSKYYQQINF